MKGRTPREFLLTLNDSWQTGDLAVLAEYYHPDVVLLPPDMGDPIVGRDAVIESYQEFLDAATLEGFEVTGLKVFSFPALAADSGHASHMAHLHFSVSYTLDGDTYLETGMEVYALREIDGDLMIVWRHQSVLDSRLAEKA